jgi:hypothetical protein
MAQLLWDEAIINRQQASQILRHHVLAPTQRNALIKAWYQHLDSVIQHGHDLGLALQELNTQQRQRLFNKVQGRLSEIIRNNTDQINVQQSIQSINNDQPAPDSTLQQIINPLESNVKRLMNKKAYAKAVAASYLTEQLKHAYVTRENDQAFHEQAQDLIQQAKQGPLAEHRGWLDWLFQRLARCLNKLTFGAIQSCGLFSYDCYRATSSINCVNEIESNINDRLATNQPS